MMTRRWIAAKAVRLGWDKLPEAPLPMVPSPTTVTVDMQTEAQAAREAMKVEGVPQPEGSE